MRRYDLTVLGISETHWTEAGERRLGTEEILLYSGHEEEIIPHTQRVAPMLSKKACKTKTSFTRICNLSPGGAQERT